MAIAIASSACHRQDQASKQGNHSGISETKTMKTEGHKWRKCKILGILAACSCCPTLGLMAHQPCPGHRARRGPHCQQPTHIHTRRRTSFLSSDAGQISVSPFESDFYDEGMPRHASATAEQQWQPSLLATEHSWGIHHSRSQEALSFPSTVTSLIEDVSIAIYGTIDGKQKLDPNYVVNAMMGNNTLGRRPIRRSFDAGRMGIELDGLSSLFDQRISEPNALRKVALQLAAELSVTRNIPVAVYFNTIRQSLMASQELQLLRRAEAYTQTKPHKESIYSNITVLTLGADDLPRSMNHERLPSAQLSQGMIDPKRGLVLVIQPTDYNAEYRPPAPAIGSVAALQRLAGGATLCGIPVVLLSPRFLTMPSPTQGWDQSGYQQSSAYGGYEPARGPTPWIMRDFSPPIYCWSERAMQVPLSEPLRDNAGTVYRDSQIALKQSVMIEGHAWHVFAKRSDVSSRKRDYYMYLASTQTSAGRPTREVLQRIHHEFAA